MQRISKRSEKLKIDLSSDTTTNLDLISLIDEEDIDFEISRNDFEQVNSHLFQACIDIVQECLGDADLKNTDIDKIVLVGGSTRIPKIQEMLMKFFEGKQLTKAINPDEAVAYGAALQAAIINKNDKLAIVQKITDVTPLSLGLSSGTRMHVVIPRNSPIPISKIKISNTTSDKAKTSKLLIYEGERTLVQYNTQIGTVQVRLPPKPPGYPFRVTFHVNANGILEVGANNEAGEYTTLVIKHEKPNTQTRDNILKDAKENKAKDSKVYNVITQWTKLSLYCVKMKALCDYDQRGITDEEKRDIRNICQQVVSWLEDNEVKDGSPQEEDAIANKSKEIENVCEPIANSYGYCIKDMDLDDFHKLKTE